MECNYKTIYNFYKNLILRKKEGSFYIEKLPSSIKKKNYFITDYSGKYWLLPINNSCLYHIQPLKLDQKKKCLQAI